ncbi:MAG: HAD-IC family P-type ATPase [Owenweeksia sp.]|nr:HAD-IC family P-type ATPase [Owenweeksia sp.]
MVYILKILAVLAPPSAAADHVVFDKTGTLTRQNAIQVKWQGPTLDLSEKLAVAAIAQNAQHPLARPLLQFLNILEAEARQAVSFMEATGEGVTAEVDERYYRLGKASFLGLSKDEAQTTSIYLEVDGQVKGYFSFYQQTRDQTVEGAVPPGAPITICHLLSGDNEAERQRFEKMLGKGVTLNFNQSPHQKLAYLDKLQQHDQKVLMIGDGLNDAGALQQSEVGISLCEENVNFFPASYALLMADSFGKLNNFIDLSNKNRQLIYYAFALSFLYNIAGLSFAVAGVLSPLVCAILMPVSSVSVVVHHHRMSGYICKKQLREAPAAVR